MREILPEGLGSLRGAPSAIWAMSSVKVFWKAVEFSRDKAAVKPVTRRPPCPGEFHMVSVFPTSNGLLNELPEGIQAEIHVTVSNLYDEMCEFMVEHKDQVEAVADLLHEFGTVDGHDIHELIERMDA